MHLYVDDYADSMHACSMLIYALHTISDEFVCPQGVFNVIQYFQSNKNSYGSNAMKRCAFDVDKIYYSKISIHLQCKYFQGFASCFFDNCKNLKLAKSFQIYEKVQAFNPPMSQVRVDFGRPAILYTSFQRARQLSYQMAGGNLFTQWLVKCCLLVACCGRLKLKSCAKSPNNACDISLKTVCKPLLNG